MLVEQDSYLLELCRYVVLNPVRAGIVKAYFDYGYTLSEIARRLGLHYATIGRIIKAAML